MFRSRVYQTLDQPLRVFGLLEATDLVISVGVMAATLAVMLVVTETGGVFAVAAGGATALLLWEVKRGRPPGYIYYLLYASGLVRILPKRLIGTASLLPPPHLWEPRIMVLAAGWSESDEDGPVAKYYRRR